MCQRSRSCARWRTSTAARPAPLPDANVAFVPELTEGGEDPLGRRALRLTGECADSGRRYELVALPDGGAFDLLGMSGQPHRGTNTTHGPDGRPLAGSGGFVVPGR